MAKSIGWQYPHSVGVWEHLWVIYSFKKEEIEVAGIPLPELYSLRGHLTVTICQRVAIDC